MIAPLIGLGLLALLGFQVALAWQGRPGVEWIAAVNLAVAGLIQLQPLDELRPLLALPLMLGALVVVTVAVARRPARDRAGELLDSTHR